MSATSQSENAIRRAFEEWINRPPIDLPIERYGADEQPWPGQYYDLSTERCWEAWREATRQARGGESMLDDE